MPRAALAPQFDVVDALDAAVPVSVCRDCPEKVPCAMWARTAQLCGVAGGQIHNPRPQQRELS